MANIGSLGDITFQVSSETVKTLDNMTWSGSARYGSHQVHLGNTLSEFSGVDLDTITFDMYLSVYLGVNPMDDIVTLFGYERDGTNLSFIVGDKVYGKYRWNVLNHKVKIETYDNAGNMTSVTLSVTLKEYTKG